MIPPIYPMKHTFGAFHRDDPNQVIDPNLLGVRAQIILQHGDICEIWGARLHECPEWSDIFYQIRDDARMVLNAEAHLDGILVSPKGVQHVLTAIGTAIANDVYFVAFDVLMLGSTQFDDKPLFLRRGALKTIRSRGSFMIIDHCFNFFTSNGQIFKDSKSLYHTGEHGPVQTTDWLFVQGDKPESENDQNVSDSINYFHNLFGKKEVVY